MAKKTHTLQHFGDGYNTKIAPRDLKDSFLAKSQGVTSERPGTLSILGKSNHLYEGADNYIYDELITSNNVLGDSRTPIHDPGSGIYSFTSEFNYGYVGLVSNFASKEDSTPSIMVTLTSDTNIYDKAGSNTALDAIPIQANDWIYIWGIKNTTGMHALNDRYFKVISVTEASNEIHICDYVYGSNAVLDMTKFSSLGAYSSSTHGGYWRTIPEQSYTNYIATQNGECIDLYYDIQNSKNIFSKKTIPIGTLGLLANNTGRIGKFGGEATLDLGLDNDFENWPQSNGINYGVKPSFFFSDNILRMWASNKISRGPSDSNSQSSSRWFGHIKRDKSFGIDAAVTTINEWYLTDANIRPPAKNSNSDVSRIVSYTTNTVLDRTSWETGALAFNSNHLTNNHIWQDGKRFSEDDKISSGTWHNIPGNINWQLHELRDNHTEIDTLTTMIRNGKGWSSEGTPHPKLPTAMYNHIADGTFRICQTDYGEAASLTALEYWHTDGGSSFSASSNYVATGGTDRWTWVKNANTLGLKAQYIQKASGGEEPLYCSMGTNATTATLVDNSVYVLSFTLSGCTDTTSGSGVYVSLQDSGGDTTPQLISTESKANHYNVRVQLLCGVAVAAASNWLIKFTPKETSWVGKISNVSLAKSYHKDNAVVVGYGLGAEVSDNSSFEGWEKEEYEFFQTFIYGDQGKRKQESCATLARTINMDSTNKRTLRLTPAVCFSSDGEHYDMMDKRIIGSKIYYRKKLTDSGSTSHDNIMLLLEMDWNKGIRQWGGGSSRWIEWTQGVLESGTDDEEAYKLNYTLNSVNPVLDVSSIENTVVMGKLDVESPYFEWEDPPITTPTYRALNGHDHNESGVANARYGTMAAVNGTTYIGDFSTPISLTSGTNWNEDIRPDYNYYPTSIVRSSAGKDDMFPINEELLHLAGVTESRIVKMYGMSKYLVVLCVDSYYILDMSDTESPVIFLDSPGNGIKHECQSVKIGGLGIIWINEHGCFLFSALEKGYGVTNLIEGKISKNKRGWVNNNEDSSLYDFDYNIPGRPNRKGLYYWDIKDDNKYIPSIGYDGEHKKIIIKKSCRCTGNNDEGHIFVYDFYTKSWTTNINGAENDSLVNNGEVETYDSTQHYSFAPLIAPENYTSNFNTVAGKDLIYHAKDLSDGVYKWYNSPLDDDNLNNISVGFKELTFDKPHNIKRIYQIYVTFRCTGDSGADMSYSLDGEDKKSTFQIGRDGTNYNNSFNDTEGKWEVASLLFGSPINCYSIQLRLEGRAMPSDFEINDITFVYKIKNVKVKI